MRILMYHDLLNIRCPGWRQFDTAFWGRYLIRLLVGNKFWTGGRAVECTGLENRSTRKGIVSSNLTLSVQSRCLVGLFYLATSCYLRLVTSRYCEQLIREPLTWRLFLFMR